MRKKTSRPPPRSSSSPRWIALIHQLPPTPAYLRVKVRRRLHQLGAFALKQTVYVLPNTEESLEDFQWLRREIEGGGGSAVIVELDFIEGVGDEEIHANLPASRPMPSPTKTRVAKDRVTAGRTWVTRKGAFVDRISSAWLIRRFIDRKARFKFVKARDYEPRRGELGFDMPNAEYTHVGEACTFQTLLRRFGLTEAALAAIGEIVHDIDCKDDAFGRAETAGVSAAMRGIAARYTDDNKRLARGADLLDDLYAHYSHR